MRDRRNVVVAILAFVTGLLVFVGNLWLARTLQPPMLRVLAAARTLRAGDVLTEDAVRVVEVYQDARASLYISEAEKDAFLGGYVARDYAAGEPLLRTAVLAPGSVEERMAGILAAFPHHVLFPIPLDADHVVAGNPSDYRPGDLVGIAVTFVDRPPEPQPLQPPSPLAFAPPAPFAFSAPLPSGSTPLPPTPIPTPTPTSVLPPYVARGKPPITKVLDEAVRVVWAPATSSPEMAEGEEGASGSFLAEPSWAMEERPVLWVLLPKEDVELLTLGLSSGRVFLYLTWKNPGSGHPGGFSYWDFEALLQAERARKMEGEGP